MSNDHLLISLAVGIFSGWLAGRILRGSGLGLVGDLVIGTAGAGIGSLLFARLGIHLGGLIGSIVTATAGALALLYLIRLLKRI